VKRGQHAADDGSFGRSAGGAMARGVALIVAAVLLGVILLRATDSPEPFASVNTDNGSEIDDDTNGAGDDDDDVTGSTDTTLPSAHDPSEVTVLVANGAGIDGLATRITDLLTAANYVAAPPGNTAPADASAVYFTSPEFEADAHAVADLLNPKPAVAALPDPSPVEDLKGAHVLVIAAADIAQATG
jgi:hypothetical protein